LRRGRFLRAAMTAGFAFLWLPIVLLVVYAFSADRIPFQWGGFSLRWFDALVRNERLVEAALLSLRVAAGAATLAVLLGGVAGWALARFGPFRGPRGLRRADRRAAGAARGGDGGCPCCCCSSRWKG
jgi:putrescine transport system permease protein